MKIVSVNPFTEEVNEVFEPFSPEECARVVAQSREAFREWRKVPVAKRAAHFTRVASGLREKSRNFAEIITREMGKPIKESVAEVEKCAWLCDYYAEHAADLLRDDIVQTEAEKSYVTFEPLGVILGIMPWNFPFWQVFRFAVPAMAAGSSCLLKHASNVPISAMEMEKLFAGSGLPANVFRTLLIGAGTAMELIESDTVDGVSLTGSIEAGSQVGTLAGKRIKPLVLELGGSDPFIVLDDADVEQAARTGVKARTINTG